MIAVDYVRRCGLATVRTFTSRRGQYAKQAQLYSADGIGILDRLDVLPPSGPVQDVATQAARPEAGSGCHGRGWDGGGGRARQKIQACRRSRASAASQGRAQERA